MRVRPIHARLVVQRLEESDQRGGAIVIPDSAKDEDDVLAVQDVASGGTTSNTQTGS